MLDRHTRRCVGWAMDDNAAMESFWSSLKRELVHGCQFATRAEARAAVFEWIVPTISGIPTVKTSPSLKTYPLPIAP